MNDARKFSPTDPSVVIIVTLSPRGELQMNTSLPLHQVLMMLLQLTEDVRLRRLREQLAAGVADPRVIVPALNGGA